MVYNFSVQPGLTWAGRWLGRLLPAHCRCCETPIADGQLCPACIEALPWNRTACAHCATPMQHSGTCPQCLRRPPRFDSAHAAFRLATPVQQSVHGLKYHANFSEAALLGDLMAMRLATREQRLPQLLLPVPLHPLRLMRRGYNQATEIARRVSQRLALPMNTHAAVRLRQTEDQIGQSKAARLRNMRGAFAVNVDLSGLHAALVDDVMTTGATLDALARACRQAGAAHIEAWAAARTP